MGAVLVHTAGAVLDDEQRCLRCDVVLLDGVGEVGGGFDFGEWVGETETEVVEVSLKGDPRRGAAALAFGQTNKSKVLFRIRHDSLADFQTHCQRAPEVQEWAS